jgi:hypothetical protein
MPPMLRRPAAVVPMAVDQRDVDLGGFAGLSLLGLGSGSLPMNSAQFSITVSTAELGPGHER